MIGLWILSQCKNVFIFTSNVFAENGRVFSVIGNRTVILGEYSTHEEAMTVIAKITEFSQGYETIPFLFNGKPLKDYTLEEIETAYELAMLPRKENRRGRIVDVPLNEIELYELQNRKQRILYRFNRKLFTETRKCEKTIFEMPRKESEGEVK